MVVTRFLLPRLHFCMEKDQRLDWKVGFPDFPLVLIEEPKNSVSKFCIDPLPVLIWDKVDYSIIIPAYNEELYLPTTIQSLRVGMGSSL